MEFMLTLDDFAVFKNNIDEYCNALPVGERREFKEFLIRLQSGCSGIQQECLGEVCTFIKIQVTEPDLMRALTALTFICATKDGSDGPAVKEVLDRVNYLYHTSRQTGASE